MQNTNKSSKSWIILGIVFWAILLIALYLEDKAQVIEISGGAETLLGAIFGFGGTLFILIGIIKFIINLFKKN